MKELLAGVTGAIGRPLVSALLATRHEVIGLSSSEKGARSLREKGAAGAKGYVAQSPGFFYGPGKVRYFPLIVWRRNERTD
jgi:nucleoside-diphosphate-sugar epimerase